MNLEDRDGDQSQRLSDGAHNKQSLFQRATLSQQVDAGDVLILSFFLIPVAALLALFALWIYSQAPWQAAGLVGGSAALLLLLGWGARRRVAMIVPVAVGLVLAAILGREALVMNARYLQGSMACQELRPRLSAAPIPEPSLRVEFRSQGDARFCIGNCLAQYPHPGTARRLLQGGLIRVELPFEVDLQDRSKRVHWRFEIKHGSDPACLGAANPEGWEKERGPYVFETGLDSAGSCMVGAPADTTTAALVLRELLTQEPDAINPITTLRQTLVVARTGEVIGFAGAANSGSHVEGSPRPTIGCSNEADTLRLLEKAGVKPQSAWGEGVDRRDTHQPAHFLLTGGAKRAITAPIAPPEVLR